MKALLISPEPGFCYYSFPEARRITGKTSLGIPLGLITAAALLPQEWQMRLVDAGNDPVREKDWAWSDIVLLSGNFLHAHSLHNLIRESKRRQKSVVVGGPYATCKPREVLDAGADFVVVGEGENTIPLFLDALRAGEKGGLFTNPERPDMARSPIPRFDLLDLDRYLYVQIQTSRGCPFDCEFCDIVARYGHKPRYKTPSQVISELDVVHQLGWRGHVFVADDNFIGSKPQAQAILQDVFAWQKVWGEPFNFSTQASVNLGQDKEMIDLMTRANFGEIFIGVESLDADALKVANKIHNVTNPMGESVDNMLKKGLSVLLSFIIGFDGEKRGAGDRICKFVEDQSVPIAMLNTLWAIPYTRLWERLEREKRLLEGDLDSYDLLGWRLNFIPSRPASEVFEEFVDVWDRLFEPTRFLERAYRGYLKMRSKRQTLREEKGGTSVGVSSQGRRSLRRSFADARAFIRLTRLLGIRYRCRGQFWRQLIGMLWQNPTRLGQYVSACAHGPDLFEIRARLLRQKAAHRFHEANGAGHHDDPIFRRRNRVHAN
jgi:radical SAM superfamily enzyme YgiQ (UPF0313 family)